ncbi:MAG: hypothetical protein JSU70_07775 [Phycisphaerales bacterium]|nr:MAG: hypothetical protein JSU70_07775 [Phycisphaerales bacterium]
MGPLHQLHVRGAIIESEKFFDDKTGLSCGCVNVVGLLAPAWSGRLSRAACKAVFASARGDSLVFTDHYLGQHVKMRKF